MFPNKDILPLIPQGPPFVFIDEVLDATTDDEAGGAVTRSGFTIPAEHVFVTGGHFSEAGLPEVIAQTAAAGEGINARQANRPVRTGMIGAVRNLEIARIPGVGEQLITETRIVDQVAGITRISGIIQCDGALVARCEMTLLLTESLT